MIPCRIPGLNVVFEKWFSPLPHMERETFSGGTNESAKLRNKRRRALAARVCVMPGRLIIPLWMKDEFCEALKRYTGNSQSLADRINRQHEHAVLEKDESVLDACRIAKVYDSPDLWAAAQLLLPIRGPKIQNIMCDETSTFDVSFRKGMQGIMINPLDLIKVRGV